MAEQRNQPFENLKQFYEQNEKARESLREQLKENKVFAFLLEKAVVKEVPRDDIQVQPESE
jgi:FKBP-type peptidyl-prolyl cis-trans isomerase (trigger factor)